LAPSANNQTNIKASSVLASAPPKPPRILDVNDMQMENVNPVAKKSEQPAVKYPAPLAPDVPSVTTPALPTATNETTEVAHPAGTASEETSHVSSVKLVFSSTHQSESPSKITITPIKQSTASPAKASNTLVKDAMASPAKVDTIPKPQAAKRAFVPAISKKVELETSNSLDVSINEPTRQPVSVRLAAWQSKQVATNQEPLPVTSRVRNYEKKVTATERPTPSRTATHLRSKTETHQSPGNRQVHGKLKASHLAQVPDFWIVNQAAGLILLVEAHQASPYTTLLWADAPLTGQC
jgi:hypothetical protein